MVMFVVASIWLVASAVYTINRIVRNRARRRILESGLLSIHSCAIMWQAVVLAHHRARYAARTNTGTYKDYTRNLGLQAAHLKRRVFQIHEWVANPDIVDEDPHLSD